jgi:hypothetical protein
MIIKMWRSSLTFRMVIRIGHNPLPTDLSPENSSRYK